MEKHTTVPFSAACTYHTVLDMEGLRTKDMVPEWSIASPNFKPGPRLVCGTRPGSVVDYDKDILPKLAERGGWHPLTTTKIATVEAKKLR